MTLSTKMSIEDWRLRADQSWRNYHGERRGKAALHCACGASTLSPAPERWQWRRFTLPAGNPRFEARCGSCREQAA